MSDHQDPYASGARPEFDPPVSGAQSAPAAQPASGASASQSSSAPYAQPGQAYYQSAPYGSYGPGPSYPPPDQGAWQPQWTYGAGEPYQLGYLSAPPAPPAPPPPSHRGRNVLVAIVAVIAALAIGGAGVLVGRYQATASSQPTVQTTPLPEVTSTPTAPSTPDAQPSTGSSTGTGDVSTVAAIIDPALVDIVSSFAYQQAEGAGTGIVLTSNGEVLTNNHVIEGATAISVTDVGNGKTYAAAVVGYNAAHDVAVLQLQGASGLATATIGKAAATVGETVVAVGNAGGVGGTPSAAGGSVVALNQSISASNELTGISEQLTGLIAVNAQIQSGDSGGALVDSSGAVLGINTAGSASYSMSNGSGTGFAIPISDAMTIATAVEAGQGSSSTHVGETAFLGVLTGSRVTGRRGQTTSSGAVVGQVVPGDPAAHAGIVAGDDITAFAGQAITSPSELGQLMVTHHPGDKVSIGWTDTSGTSHTATVTLVSGPPA